MVQCFRFKRNSKVFMNYLKIYLLLNHSYIMLKNGVCLLIFQDYARKGFCKSYIFSNILL